MPIPDNMKLIEYTELQEKLKDLHPQFTPTTEYKAPEVFVRPNPVHESNELLRKQNDKINELSDKFDSTNNENLNQTKELQSIHYEDMKLNAQINTLIKIIDSQNDELTKLRDVNAELKLANNTLKENNKHYWRNTFIISFIVAGIFFVLGYII